ncbi:MAG TPA: PDZ domain-containing protein [Phaeodactylibacter sp.]|nr:PDZ domain-containing protein [Phaeodactylibacter sp.]
MKRKHLFFGLLVLLLSFGAKPSIAQQTGDETTKIIIIKKSVDEDGVESIEKTIIENDGSSQISIPNQDGSDEPFLINIEDDNGNKTIHISSDSKLQGACTEVGVTALKECLDKLKLTKTKMDNLIREISSSPKPALGVVLIEVKEDNSKQQAILIEEVIDGSAAAEAGLNKGDLLISIDGKGLQSIYEVIDIIGSKEVGSEVSITYLRNGVQQQTTATLKAGSRKKSSCHTLPNEEEFWGANFEEYLKDLDFSLPIAETDPCKVFIGVFTNSGTANIGKGVLVKRVIKDTPASNAGLQAGDIILAIDDAQVNNHKELLTERNKYAPGDHFSIRYLRNGIEHKVDAQFKKCDDAATSEQATAKEQPRLHSSSNDLDVDLQAYPNPTKASVNIRFQGEKVPTVVSLRDARGREIFREEIKDFDGNYERKVNLKDAAAGSVFITIQQGNKTLTEKVLYIPDRA